MARLEIEGVEGVTVAGLPEAGATVVGRADGSDVVIEHPTISRAHARVSCRDGDYFIEDLGSSNGTRVNGRSVGGAPHVLVDGSRLRLGRVKATFSLAAAPPPDGPVRVTGVDGPLFTCQCGARLWASAGAVGRTLRCSRCDAPVQIPRRGDARAASNQTAVGVKFESPAGDDGVAAAKVRRPVCSVCQWAVEPMDAREACPTCGNTYHAECWAANRGCAAYGCGSAPATDPAPIDPASAEATGADPVPADVPTPRVARADHEFRLALPLLGVAAGVAGLFAFGVPSIVLGAAIAARARRRAGAVAAVVVCVVGAVAGLALSGGWWLGWHVPFAGLGSAGGLRP